MRNNPEQESIETRTTGKWNAWFCLLSLPFIGTLWVPFFNFYEPVMWGIPFFYFYQMAWIPVSAFITGLVYFMVQRS